MRVTICLYVTSTATPLTVPRLLWVLCGCTRGTQHWNRSCLLFCCLRCCSLVQKPVAARRGMRLPDLQIYAVCFCPFYLLFLLAKIKSLTLVLLRSFPPPPPDLFAMFLGQNSIFPSHPLITYQSTVSDKRLSTQYCFRHAQISKSLTELKLHRRFSEFVPRSGSFP